MATSARTFAHVDLPSAVGGVSNAIQQIQGTAQANSAFNASQAALNRDWQRETNKIAMDFSAQEAAKNRDWQKMMSDTAHQREIRDLKAAGLNPVLSAMGGNGAAVTSGATASGVSSGGSAATADTSANAAFVGLLGSLLSSQTQLAQSATSAISNLAVANKYNETNKYLGELQSATGIKQSEIAARANVNAAYIHAQATLNSANINATAQRYVADKHLQGSQAQAAAQRISATISAAAKKYGDTLNADNQKAIAELNADVNRELKEMGIKAEFDFAEQYPSNEWQADPGQANARSWIDSITSGLRDIGIGASNIGDLINTIFQGFKKPGKIGF